MYQINLFYGYEESESGIFHAFRAEDPDKEVDIVAISRDLAEQLDRTVDDGRFTCNSMYINLPDELVARIKKDAVIEHLACRDDPKRDLVSVTVYKDALGYYDEDDNLAEILVPKDWLEEALRAEGFQPYKLWGDEYTADDTVGLASRALADKVIQGCSGIDMLADGAKVEWHYGLYEVVGIYDGLVYLQHVNNDVHAEIAIDRFVKDAELVSEADISRSSLGEKIAAAEAAGNAAHADKAEPVRGLDRD